jgi:hypothetical protein
MQTIPPETLLLVKREQGLMLFSLEAKVNVPVLCRSPLYKTAQFDLFFGTCEIA